jgi:tRNA threonylcarbamoyladenosine biosynthesis protein TsaB
MTSTRPPIFLAIESSTDFGSVAVGAESGVVAEVASSVRAGHSTGLLPAADQALRSAGLQATDLSGVVVGGGPGSFTGIRISGATAKGIVHALEIPLYAYSSLLATATQAWASPGLVCALADARGRDVYAATYCFQGGLEVVHPPAATTVDEIIDRFADSPRPIFIGQGAARHADELASRLGASVADVQLAVPRAAALLWLAFRWPDSGLVADSAAWQPDYLRPSGAERIAASRAGQGTAE